jgi:DNA polymerase III epsilon subunit-like protein
MRYVIPKIQIQCPASEVTGITCINKQMFYNGKPVDGLPLRQALSEFLEYLGGDPVILVGHNIKVFDCHVLINASKACGMDISKHISGFLDTLVLFRSENPGFPSYKQENLYKHFITGSYNAHNALDDVGALSTLLDTVCPNLEIRRKYTFLFSYIMESQKYNSIKNANLPSWEQLICGKFISKCMAEKAAGSSLRPEHLALAFKRNGAEGVESVLTEISNGTVRVTKSKKVILQLVKYFHDFTDENNAK